MRFVLRRQSQILSQLLDRLINGESRRIGRDFEENAARLTKIDRVEVLAIDHRRNGQTGRDELFSPGDLFFVIGSAKRDVMNRSGSDMAETSVCPLDDI